MKAAALRLGSQGLNTSFDDHLLIIGDAAGHIDPLTGEGIHTAIMVRRNACIGSLCNIRWIIGTRTARIEVTRRHAVMCDGSSMQQMWKALCRRSLKCCVASSQGGKAAAETMLDMRMTGDYSKQSTKEYQRRWIQLFGHDFHMVRDCSRYNRQGSQQRAILFDLAFIRHRSMVMQMPC